MAIENGQIRYRVVEVPRFRIMRGDDTGNTLTVREVDADFIDRTKAEDIARMLADQDNGTFEPDAAPFD